MAQDRGSDRRFLPFAPHPCHKCQIFIGCWLQVLPGVWHCSSIFSWKKSQHHPCLVDKDWYQLTAVLNFGVLKRIWNPHSLLNFILGFQAAEFKFESEFEPLQVIWQSFPKAIREYNRRFLLQNQWPSSWGCAPAQIGRLDGRAQTQVVSCSAAVAAGCDRLA